MMPTVSKIVDEHLHLKSSHHSTSRNTPSIEDAPKKSEKPLFVDDFPKQTLNVPQFWKMVSEPLSDFKKEPTPPKLGISRSQEDDDDDDDRKKEMDEQLYGRISPIVPIMSTRGSVGTFNAYKPSNLRLKFRKSHTCGSLYANCNCSSPPGIPVSVPAPNVTKHTTLATTITNTHSAPIITSPVVGTGTGTTTLALHTNTQTASTERAYFASNSTGSNATSSSGPFSFSISPTSNETSLSSSLKHSSGFHSLSAQTSSATSAQLSHDESMSTSFDYTTSTAACSNQLATVTACNDNAHSLDSTSPAGAKQAYSSESEVHNSGLQKNSQTPRISSTLAASSNAQSTQQQTHSIEGTAAVSWRKSERKPKRLFQSYSHPDTDYIFTDQNKKPSKESLIQLCVQQEPVIKSRGGKVEIKQPKRSSSPNIGQYQVLDVAVHPDILVKVSPKHSPVAESRRLHSPLITRSAQQRRRLLQRSHEVESGSSTSESEHSLDVKSPTYEAKTQPATESSRDPNQLAKELKENWAIQLSPTLKTKSTVPRGGTASPTSLTHVTEDTNFNAAQKYFAESGILGPISTAAAPLIKKTSKILQDVNVIEQIRKNSMILRANSLINNGNNSGQHKQTTPPPPPVTSTTHSSPEPIAIAGEASKSTLANGSTTCSNSHVSSVIETPAHFIFTPSAPQSPHTMATTCGFSPNMTTKSCNVTDDRDAQIKSLQGEIVSLKDVIKSRDVEIVKLRREIHKLKSVLQQTTNTIPLAKDELLQSPTSPTQRYPTCAACKKKLEFESSLLSPGVTMSSIGTDHLTPESSSSIDSNLSENYQSCNSQSTGTGTTTATCALASANLKNHNVQIDTALNAASTDALACNGIKPKLLPTAQAPVLKKQGVSGESCETSMQQSFNVPIQKYDKDYRSKQLIKEAIMDNDFLKNIDASQVRELVESMYPLTVAKGEFVIREGEAGAHLYVSAEGEFEVVKSGKVLGVMGPGKAFGELAILYNCTRTASIRVLSDARVWVLDRRVFQQIMMRTGMQRIENSVNFLKSVPLLKNLSVELLAKIADVLEVEFYPAGTYIIRQGASGDTFFLISQGSVKVTQKVTPTSEEKEIRILERGDYFGEQALINEDKRTANIIALAPGVECLTLDRDSFTQLIGDLCELKEKNYGDENRVLAMKFAERTKEVFGANVKQEFPDMKLTDLEVIATLGIGGFGRVELVKAYRENSVDIFALKCLKKRHIIETKQEEHVFSERTIMLTCNTPFICRLYRTFRDEKYVYMLLEACMGGEIWTMLRDRGSFSENATQFIVGCVLQAFEYLHARGIIYRDLKPENLMLDERGYVKLVDFGFAKYIGNSNKTWTFCGTPEYVAPEIILNKGHDRAVDYWALGILIHELLNGTPPFTANDPMKTYNIILKGIDMIDFPKHMTRSAVQLIKKLCRDVPAERLGYQKGGIQDIKKHKWFLGFDWDGLEQQLLIPPFVRPISHPTDTCYFDKFPCDPEEPPDELSGWDLDF